MIAVQLESSRWVSGIPFRHPSVTIIRLGRAVPNVPDGPFGPGQSSPRTTARSQSRGREAHRPVRARVPSPAQDGPNRTRRTVAGPARLVSRGGSLLELEVGPAHGPVDQTEIEAHAL